MSKKHLSLMPQYINKYAWYYETKKGIEIYWNGQTHINLVIIPWRKLKKSLERWGRKEKP